MEQVKCNLCGSEDSRKLFDRKDLSLEIEGCFSVVQCKNCSLVYQNPRPTLSELFNQYYTNEYDQYIPSIRKELSFIRRWDKLYGLRKRCNTVMNFQPFSKNILDIGCSTGNFLDLMREYGWSIQGVEPSSTAATYAQDHLDIPIHCGTLEEAHFGTDVFDVVTMWDVIEHLPDPAGSLLEISRVLKPNGLLVIATPQLESLDAKLFGRFWIGYELPRHLTIFSRHTLSVMTKRMGFDLLQQKCFYGSFFAFNSSMRFFIRSFLKSEKLRSIIESFMFSLPARIILAPYFIMADRLKLSSTITSFYRNTV